MSATLSLLCLVCLCLSVCLSFFLSVCLCLLSLSGQKSDFLLPLNPVTNKQHTDAAVDSPRRAAGAAHDTQSKLGSGGAAHGRVSGRDFVLHLLLNPSGRPAAIRRHRSVRCYRPSFWRPLSNLVQSFVFHIADCADTRATGDSTRSSRCGCTGHLVTASRVLLSAAPSPISMPRHGKRCVVQCRCLVPIPRSPVEMSTD